MALPQGGGSRAVLTDALSAVSANGSSLYDTSITRAVPRATSRAHAPNTRPDAGSWRAARRAITGKRLRTMARLPSFPQTGPVINRCDPVLPPSVRGGRRVAGKSLPESTRSGKSCRSQTTNETPQETFSRRVGAGMPPAATRHPDLASLLTRTGRFAIDQTRSARCQDPDESCDRAARIR